MITNVKHSPSIEYEIKPEVKQPAVKDDVQLTPEANQDYAQLNETESSPAEETDEATLSKGSFLRRHKWLLVIGAVVLAVSGSVGWRWWQ